MTGTVLTRLSEALNKAAAGNSHAAVPAAAILWTDKERLWESALPRLLEAIPQLLVLGTFASDARSGPAIWLKCAIAKTVGDLPPSVVPVIYMPGISRADLRAIESCPRDLQPLAELQYRGVFWSQANSKDWTLNAFLSSKNGGLGLDIAQDKTTQEALAQALAAGVLLERTVDELMGRQINAEWLYSLLAPNPTRDILVWMNDPEATRKQWNGVRWDVFAKRCKTDFGVDPIADGVLVAAEMLAKGVGKWAAVSELYRDSYTSFANVYALLAKVQPPQQGLFDDLAQMAGYPQANEHQEAALRYALLTCSAMTGDQARAAILAADKEHGLRRNWLWARMGQSTLATALGYLADVATNSAQIPAGSHPDQLAQSYQQVGWKVDEAALRALAAVQAKADVEAISTALRAVYMPWMDELANRLQEAVKSVGGLPHPKNMPPSNVQPDGVCTVFVDGLRYDVAVQLKDRLVGLGKASLEARWTSMPSVTASGKAWCSPVAHLVSGDKSDTEFEPRVASDGKPLSGHNFRKLLTDNGVQALHKHETGDPAGKAWTECGDLDHYGHEHGIRLARDLDIQLNQVVERLSELNLAGWKRFRIVTDHGWLLMPGELPKSELPKHQAATRWGRCAVLKDSAHGTSLTFGWDWCKDVQVAYAPGVSCFIAGNEYAHGGLSLQECLVPVIVVEAEAAPAAAANVNIRSVTWKGLRCVVEVSAEVGGLKVDIRTKPALASSTLAASVRTLEAGKANLAVADDEHMGTAAVIVVLSPSGEVLQKVATTVGG
ncbi:BREX-1 system phosphatase PglZ type B [Noviherbaspirillum sp. UKPF54]|uniref:BREX-1 system phosphatase PglZ type B n=1 Tax=Noviherbaspirillum sp. UKPF54 TaxID=2601898 RepID=UPI0011B1AC87|nr:BREX-1 system phosphatase PglZ type B [Noviherbaspirillum sp. UKPF54]QDZ26595.1 BREX-1 system phosphatase PglZ type B [Noviherbaspirillum sp. UKPF54]